MSGTTSTISILKIYKTIKTISTNYDGDASYTGRILNESYVDTKSVERLIDEGNISGLHASENLSNNKPALVFSTKKECQEYVQYHSLIIFSKKKTKLGKR